MGGYGSGRRYLSWAKSTTTDYRVIDVGRLSRDGLLKPGLIYSWQWLENGKAVADVRITTEVGRIVLAYRARSVGDDWQDMHYPVYLDYTACNYGGRRVWFRCPAMGCGRRVAKLYGGKIFACRHCHNLAYDCQREQGQDRLIRKLDKLRDRLSWQPGFLNGKEARPKGMRQRTYSRLCEQYEAVEGICLLEVSRNLGLIEW